MICKQCGEDKPKFARGLCQLCYNRERTNKEPDRAYENKLKRLYDMTLTEYDEMLESQGNGCWICGRTPGEEGKRLAVDHNHITGKPRALLCGDCNRGIGMFRDSPQLTAKATEYLLIDWYKITVPYQPEGEE